MRGVFRFLPYKILAQALDNVIEYGCENIQDKHTFIAICTSASWLQPAKMVSRSNWAKDVS